MSGLSGQVMTSKTMEQLILENEHLRHEIFETQGRILSLETQVYERLRLSRHVMTAMTAEAMTLDNKQLHKDLVEKQTRILSLDSHLLESLRITDAGASNNADVSLQTALAAAHDATSESVSEKVKNTAATMTVRDASPARVPARKRCRAPQRERSSSVPKMRAAADTQDSLRPPANEDSSSCLSSSSSATAESKQKVRLIVR